VGHNLVRYEGEAQHYCPNEHACPPQITGRIEHFVGRKMMNIDGLGGETVVACWCVQGSSTTWPISTTCQGPIAGTGKGLGREERNQVIEGIAASKRIPFEQVLFAIGIRHVGETVAKKIARR
jgi:DNA ligase (NAD+)